MKKRIFIGLCLLISISVVTKFSLEQYAFTAVNAYNEIKSNSKVVILDAGHGGLTNTID